MSKKRVTAVALILICLALIANSTFAYFTHEATAHNVITTGKVDFSIKNPEGGIGGIGGSGGAIRIMPGTTVSRTAIVKNGDTAQDAYVRAKVDTVVHDSNGNLMALTDAEINQNIILIYDEPDWTLVDGWWYFNEPLKAGHETPSLFSAVSFSTNMDNKFQGCTVTVTVTFHAVQAKNNGSSVFDAVGWPA